MPRTGLWLTTSLAYHVGIYEPHVFRERFYVVRGFVCTQEVYANNLMRRYHNFVQKTYYYNISYIIMSCKRSSSTNSQIVLAMIKVISIIIRL